MKRNQLVGALGGSGFLLVIKGIAGVVENIWMRPSSSWRTALTIQDFLLYFLFLISIQMLVSAFRSARPSFWKLIPLVLLAGLLFLIPLFDTTLFSVHPVILVLLGASLLPMMGQLK
ncbi:hypothetical protein [Jeotgalibaca caeni]|uniref:hypothetical protein n=1 Tax=Jeotgalibaca caeni TaxID=3028623 RepID=UPI00237D391E|nr:hypothetical protein [Jeotgalibaca caeni]MDE1549425.1 hypothetical protein [Jeotgalibaca caeni]